MKKLRILPLLVIVYMNKLLTIHVVLAVSENQTIQKFSRTH